jgi:hypothetical protein
MANPLVSDIIERAKLFANDSDGNKHDEQSYLAYLNTAIALLYQRHPSAYYISSVIVAAPTDVQISDELAVNPVFTEPLARYVASRCLIEGAAGDDETNRKLAKDHEAAFMNA